MRPAGGLPTSDRNFSFTVGDLWCNSRRSLPSRTLVAINSRGLIDDRDLRVRVTSNPSEASSIDDRFVCIEPVISPGRIIRLTLPCIKIPN